jgi:AcrR family transcriptional regulator
MVDVPAPPARPTGPGEPHRPAPRQARAVATREAILTAAAHEFAAEGYHAASLSKILDRSGVTKGALYFHFASKEAMADAVFAVVEQRFPEITAAFEALGYDPMTTAIRMAVGIADVFAADVHVRGGMRAVSEGVLGAERSRWAHQYWDDVYLDLFERARAAGLVRAGTDARDLARTVVALGNGHRVVSTATTGGADLRERAVASLSLLLACVADPTWWQQWEAAGGMASLPLGNPLAGVPESGPDPVP